jgi:hypothetical protein
LVVSSKNPDRIDLEFFKDRDGKWLPPTVLGISQGAFEVPSGGVSVGDEIFVAFTTDHTPKKTRLWTKLRFGALTAKTTGPNVTAVGYCCLGSSAWTESRIGRFTTNSSPSFHFGRKPIQAWSFD